MTLIIIIALGSGCLGFSYLGAVLLGKEAFATTSRRTRTAHIIVASVLLLLFLVQVIMRFHELPLWLAVFACAGLVSGFISISTRYPMPPTQANNQPHDAP